MTEAGPQTDTLTTLLSRAVARHPERVFLEFASDTYTYGDIDRESTRLAHGLMSLGVVRGETVATMLDNSVDAVLVGFATNKIGAIAVPLNTALKGEYLRSALAESACKVFIAETHYDDRISQVTRMLPELRSVLWRGRPLPETQGHVRSVPLDAARIASTAGMDDLNRADDLAMLIYTAGTTGASKGCMISHNYVCNLARQAIDSVHYMEGDVFWTPLPLFHINAAANITAVLLAGASASIYPRFSLSNFWPEIARTGATVISLLGSMVSLIADAPDSEHSRKCFGQIRVVSGAPFPPQLQEVSTNKPD